MMDKPAVKLIVSYFTFNDKNGHDKKNVLVVQKV
jgi:hypothetical protein